MKKLLLVIKTRNATSREILNTQESEINSILEL